MLKLFKLSTSKMYADLPSVTISIFHNSHYFK